MEGLPPAKRYWKKLYLRTYPNRKLIKDKCIDRVNVGKGEVPYDIRQALKNGALLVTIDYEDSYLTYSRAPETEV